MNNGYVNEQWICQSTMDMPIYNDYVNEQWICLNTKLCQSTMIMSKYKVV